MSCHFKEVEYLLWIKNYLFEYVLIYFRNTRRQHKFPSKGHILSRDGCDVSKALQLDPGVKSGWIKPIGSSDIKTQT
jgi:hypothetical protein